MLPRIIHVTSIIPFAEGSATNQTIEENIWITSPAQLVCTQPPDPPSWPSTVSYDQSKRYLNLFMSLLGLFCHRQLKLDSIF